ncbi:MAG: PD40 domain-containing protein [Candidatus Marinimicrobia bacterium]|nr:PD40 domain-containing protein [Candidatus Neomarinimicrobiota bacterium]
MTARRIFSITFSLFLILSVLESQSISKADILFEKAKYIMETEGDLEKAIKNFQKITKKYPENRKVAAQSLLYTGLCYEKLGRNEAAKAYQSLVDNYPGQKDEVTIARKRLDRLMLTAEKDSNIILVPKFTKINIPTELRGSVKLSPDGMYLAMVSEKKLWKMPLSGNLGPNYPGTPVQLNTGGIKVEWSGLAWSGDGKWITFNDYPEENKQTQGIYIVPSNGGDAKRIVECFRDVRTINYQISLSPKGEKLAFSSIEDKQQHLKTISVKAGKPKQLTDAMAREPVFSPNGKLIAYVEDKDLGKSEGDQGLWIIPAEGGTPNLIAEAGKASSPVWSPDGKKIAFVDLTSDKKINIIPVSKSGKAAGKVTTIDVPASIEGVRHLAGWTPANKIGAILQTNQEYAIYTLPVAGGQAAIILNDVFALQPRWSPDGQQIFFTTIPAEGDNKYWRMTLASVSATGGVRKFLPQAPGGKRLKPFGGQGGNRISPDGKTIISAAWCTDDTLANINWPGSHIWKISIDGTEQTKLTEIDGPYVDVSPSWSPDGKEVAFTRIKLYEPPTDMFGESSIYTVSSSGGTPKRLITESGKWLISPVWSHDGKMIAYITEDKEASVSKALNVINVNTGKSRVVGKVPAAHFNIDLAWSPDNKRIAFNDKKGKVIKVMSLDDGSIEDIKTNLGDVQIFQLDWSPDGKRFVFGGVKGGNTEFWFLENFLPLEKLAQNEEPEGIVIKQVWTGPEVDNSGSVSVDGEYLSFVDWETGDLALRNLKTRENQRITHEATLEDPQQFADLNKISPDGKQVAYYWYNKNETTDLRVIRLSDNSKVTLDNSKGEMYPCFWFPEGDKIIVQGSRKKENVPWQLSLINVNSGEIQLLKEFENGFMANVSLSPDEKYLAFDFQNVKNKGNSDINLLSIDGKNEIPLIKHPAKDKLLGWLPNRNELLFTSDRSGTWDLWAIPVIDGKPSEDAKRIYTDIGEIQPMGFTENGDCYFSFSRRIFNTYIVPFNLDKGELNEHSGKFILGSNFQVKWSPDGKYIAYIKENLKADNWCQLTVQDLKTGEERKLATNLFTANSPCWSPDGNSILVIGRPHRQKYTAKDYNGGVYLVDVKTGKTSEIVLLSDYEFNRPADASWPVSDVQWSLDGKSIFFLFYKDRLVKHDLESGKEKVLYKHSHFNRNILSRSPDGKSLLFAIYNSREKKSHLFTMPVEGGKEIELCTPQEGNYFGMAAWSPDGKYIFFSDGSEGTNLWRIPADGGIPEKVWHLKNRIEFTSIHPDGKQMAFSIRERTSEIRVIEGLVRELEKNDNN